MENQNIARLFLLASLMKINTTSASMLFLISSKGSSGVTVREAGLFSDTGYAHLGNLAESTVYYNLHLLTKKGYLIKSETPSDDGGRPRNVYHLSHKAHYFFNQCINYNALNNNFDK